MWWLLTLSITTCRVWPRSHGVPDSPPSPQAGCFDFRGCALIVASKFPVVQW